MKESAALWRVSAAVLSLIITPLLMFIVGVYISKWLGMGIEIPAGLAALGLISAIVEMVRAVKKYNRVVALDEKNKYQ